MRNSSTVAKSGLNTLTGFTGRSARDHSGSVEVGVCFVTARHTPKLILGLAILFGYMVALSTLSAGVTRINSDQRNSRQNSLIGQEQTQLGECPGMQNSTLLAPGLNPFTDARKIFELQSTPRAFSFGNDLLGNAMVYMRGESSFTPRQQLQTPFSGTGLRLLEFGPQPAMSMPDRLDLAATIPFTIRSRSNIGHTEVYSQEILGSNRRVIRKIDRAVQIELPFTVSQVGLPFDAIKPFSLVFSIDQWNDYPSFRQSPQTYFVYAFKPKDALVVGDSSVGFESRTIGLVAGEALNCLTNSPNCHLSGQTKAGADFRVGQFVYRGLAEDFGVKTEASRKRSGCVAFLHRQQEPLPLVGIGQELKLKRQFNHTGVYHSVIGAASEKQSALCTDILFLYQLKRTVSKDQIL
jgi:hypothetical protein